jgi:serine/threonine protein phosphatase PrpC
MKVRDGWRLDGVLSVSRAIGDLPFKNSGLSAEPEITRFDLEGNQETLILTTDGLLHSLSLKAITDSFTNLKTQGFSYGQIAKQICQQAIDNGVKDNVTIIFVDLTKYFKSGEDEPLEVAS